MKSIIESSVYLVIMALICIISLDFIFINKSICKGQELQQYIKDTITIYADSSPSHDIDNLTYHKINNLAMQYNSSIDLEYFDTVNNYDYYNVTIMYPVKSGIFNIKKMCSFSSIVSVIKEAGWTYAHCNQQQLLNHYNITRNYDSLFNHQ